MDEQGIIIPNLALAGYRSFGKELQYFDQFAKINLFIGQNNAGKSNVLRFLTDVYQYSSKIIEFNKLPSLEQKREERQKYSFEALDQHFPDNSPVLLGIGEKVDMDALPSEHRLIAHLKDNDDRRRFAAQQLCKVMKEKARIDNRSLCWILLILSNNLPEREEFQEMWSGAFKLLFDDDVHKLSGYLGAGPRLSREQTEQRLIEKIESSPLQIKAQLIPAIRRIGEKGSSSDTFDGTGIIERLAKLQHPSNLSSYKEEKKLFENIQSFLREVINRPDAILEIPEEKHTIHVDMDGRVLPIESLGTGIHEVVILAAAATVLSEHVVCIEEPELHLNPILQRKLIRYLAAHTSNQYFITTHSAVLMDVPDAEIYHIKLVNGASVVERVTSGRQKSAVCEDLGYHPSDLLQANCIIWVEGPSDRIYLNWWLKSMDKDLVEGIHYSIMFYGGRLLSHLSNDDIEATDVDDFISLRRMNNRGVILIDSDKENEDSPINETKRRLQDEFDLGPGHAWITEGREIENYLPAEWVEAAIKAVHPKAKKIGPFGKYDNTLNKGEKETYKKVKVAHHIKDHCQPDFSIYDLKKQMEKLTEFIRKSNPKSALSN